MTGTTPITIDVGDWSTASGSRVGLALDPESRRVYSYYTIGAGTPTPIYLNRHMSLGAVPVSTVPESLAEWLGGQIGILESLIGCYQGCEWDGSNSVGKWSDDARGASCGFFESLNAATAEDIATYWDAGDWFIEIDAGQILDEIGNKAFDTYCEEQVRHAADDGVHLDLDDVKATLRDALERIDR